MTREEKLRICKNVLTKLNNTKLLFFLCLLFNEEGHNIEDFPEVMKYKPKDADYVWWGDYSYNGAMRSKKQHRRLRKNLMKKAIKDLETQ